MKSLISKLYKWIFQEQEITIKEFHELNNPEKTRIRQNKKIKFTEIAITNDYLVKGPDGFVPINKSLKTVRYQKYTITTNSGLSLSCADEHIIFNGIDGFNNLDYISCWFYKGSNYIEKLNCKNIPYPN